MEIQKSYERMKIVKEELEKTKDIRKKELSKYFGRYPGVYDFSNDKELREYYKENFQESVKSLIENYDWTPLAKELLFVLRTKYQWHYPHRKKVLDFGCGIGDYAIVFAEDYEVYLCDLKEVLDLAEWRLKERNLNCTRIEVNDKFESILPEKMDLIIVTECFEHLRNPMAKLKEMYECLNDDGFLFYDSFPSEDAEVGKDHLKEAVDQQKDLIAFLNENFTEIDITLGYLWRKKKKVEE